MYRKSRVNDLREKTRAPRKTGTRLQDQPDLRESEDVMKLLCEDRQYSVLLLMSVSQTNQLYANVRTHPFTVTSERMIFTSTG